MITGTVGIIDLSVIRNRSLEEEIGLIRQNDSSALGVVLLGQRCAL